MAKRAKERLNVPVSFGGVSIGDGTASIGVSISRDEFSLEDAETILCGHRLIGRLQAGGKGDAPNQRQMFDGARAELSASFDVKRFGCSRNDISARLAFNLSDDLVKVLGCFAKKEGRLIVAEVEDLADSADDSDEE